MSRLRYILRNINLLNIMLAVVIVLLAGYVILPHKTKIRYTLPVAKTVVEGKEEKTANVLSPSPLEYTVIAEQNIFHPSRKIPVGKKDERPEVKPEFVLYGTLITDSASLAFLEDLKSPQGTPGRGKRQRALRAGETLSGYILKEIHHDRVVMVKGEERVEVRVLDPRKTRVAATVATGIQAPPQQPPAQTPAQGALSTKPRRAGLPPGTIVKEGTPPQGPSLGAGGVPPPQVPMVKERLEGLIKQKTNR